MSAMNEGTWDTRRQPIRDSLPRAKGCLSVVTVYFSRTRGKHMSTKNKHIKTDSSDSGNSQEATSAIPCGDSETKLQSCPSVPMEKLPGDNWANIPKT